MSNDSDPVPYPSVSYVWARYVVSNGDVGESLELYASDGQLATFTDVDTAITAASQIAERDRCVTRVIKLTETARVTPSLAAKENLS